jgi:outer membrane protein TolC
MMKMRKTTALVLAGICFLCHASLAQSQVALPAEPLELTVQSAVLMALTNNRALKIDRLDQQVRLTVEEQARAAFDPVIGLQASRRRADGEQMPAGGAIQTLDSDKTSGGVSVGKALATGTKIAVEGTVNSQDESTQSNAFVSARAGLTITQSLLRGGGTAVNLARVRLARLDTLASEYELRGYVMALVAEVEAAYWDYALVLRKLEIVANSLALAGRHLDETQERIKVGKTAESEKAAAQAEVALRQEDAIDARNALEVARLRALRLCNPPGSNLWSRTVVLKDQPVVPAIDLDEVAAHVELALRLRPDLNQARLAIQRGDIEVIRTRNGLLPKLDLFVNLGKSGYSDSFGGAAGRAGKDAYDAAGGFVIEYPFGNREAQALHRRAVLSRAIAIEALQNLIQLAEVDVRSAHLEVQRAQEQVGATAATRRLQEEALNVEQEKFRLGRSTSLLVAQAERNLLASQLAESQAVVKCRRAIVDLYRQDGSLLSRRGIQAPGAEPVPVP